MALNNIIDRIKIIIAYYNISVRAFAIKCGIKQNTLNNQLVGLREISLSTINAILISNQEISAEWLLRGKGEMILSESTSYEKQTDLVDMLKIQELILKQDEIIKELKKQNMSLLSELHINGR